MDVADDDDRISELPVSLIHHILSFLPIKCIASTTVLSKRWNNLWVSLPLLNFTQWRSSHPCIDFTKEEADSDEDSDYRVTKDSTPLDLSETNRFMDFMDKVLFLDNLAHVKKFWLRTDSMHFDQDRVKNWIKSVVMHNVEELFLSVKCSGPRAIPIEVFHCESLTGLDLLFENKQLLDQSPSFSKICFPRLEKFRISYVEFKDKALAMQLFSNCPELVDLHMTNVSWKGLDVICFALPQLKVFDIRGSGESIQNVKVRFETPNLLSLTWSDCLPKEFIVDSFPCLVEAGICYAFAKGYTRSIYDSLCKFTDKVSHVKHLMVSYTYIWPKVLDDSSVLPRSYHTFHNLTSLEVVGCIYYGKIGSVFDVILQYSPKLTSLVFHKLLTSREVAEDGLTLHVVPHCLLTCLMSIEFRTFYGLPKEMEVVKLFLESARVLQTVTLGSSLHYLELNKKNPTAKEVEDGNNEILEQLQAFSWASADCVVKFLSP